jgi:hypothetical protein
MEHRSGLDKVASYHVFAPSKCEMRMKPCVRPEGNSIELPKDRGIYRDNEEELRYNFTIVWISELIVWRRKSVCAWPVIFLSLSFLLYRKIHSETCPQQQPAKGQLGLRSFTILLRRFDVCSQFPASTVVW